MAQITVEYITFYIHIHTHSITHSHSLHAHTNDPLLILAGKLARYSCEMPVEMWQKTVTVANVKTIYIIISIVGDISDAVFH